MVAKGGFSMRKPGKLMITATCFFLFIVCGCVQKPQPNNPLEPISGQYIVIEDNESGKYYLVDDGTELADFYAILPSAISLKELPSYSIYVIEDGLYKHAFSYYDTSLYANWDQEVPEDLDRLIKSVVNIEHEVVSHTFYAENPTNYSALMNSLNKEESLFYYPSSEVDSQYSRLTLYYKCTDMSLERVISVPVGQLTVDDVFIPVIDFLNEKELFYKSTDASYYSTNYSTNPHYFERKVEILLNLPLEITVPILITSREK
jgi:hypothetical protein